MNLNGLLLVDKPSDLTSHDVVHRARKILGLKAVGHTGTLDPLATGLMVLVVGEATKLSEYLTFSDKTYRVTARFGQTTDTLDRSGQVLSERLGDVDPELARAEALKLEGTFQWPVPLFSAAKVNGRKLYEHGRSGEAVDLPIKEMGFFGVEVEEATHRSVTAVLSCTKGSFIRSWCSVLGENLGLGGVMDELRRLRVGHLRIEDAVSLETLAETMALSESQSETQKSLGSAFIPMLEVLPEWRAVRVGPKEERLLSNGQIPRDLSNRLIFEQKEACRVNQELGIKVVTHRGELLSLLLARPGQGLKIKRVFKIQP